MKLEVLQENLSLGLNIASRVLSSKPQLTILSHLLLSATDGKLTITASNQETTLVTEIGAKVTTPGDFTLPGRTLVEIISSLSAEKISLELEGTVLTLKSGGFKATINGTPAQEFPSLVPKDLPKDPYWQFDRSQLQNLISKTIFCAATDESRAVLTGVLFKSLDDGLTLAATDGFRLSALKLGNVNSKSKDVSAALIIPAKTLQEVARVLSDSKHKTEKEKSPQVKIFVFGENNQILFDLDDIKIYSRLIAGNFPDFEKIIPTSSILKLSLSSQDLSKAVRLASIFARESANIVKLKTENGKLKISANAPQVGENESEVDIKINGDNKDDLTIAFNFRYLLDLLASVPEGDLTIELSGPTAPGVFRFPSDPNFLHLIMPVRVQN